MNRSKVYLAAFHGKNVRGVEGLLLVVRSSFKSLLGGTIGVGDHLIPDLLEKRSGLPVASLSTAYIVAALNLLGVLSLDDRVDLNVVVADNISSAIFGRLMKRTDLTERPCFLNRAKNMLAFTVMPFPEVP